MNMSPEEIEQIRVKCSRLERKTREVGEEIQKLKTELADC